MPYQDKFLSTQKPLVRIIPDPELVPLPWQSKIGGNPYLPTGSSFPVNPEGDHLCFLAQLNFAEMPVLEGFPRKGILQFYIFDDGLYGLNEENPEKQDNFRVLFFENPVQDEAQLITDFSFLRTYGELPISGVRSYGLRFEHDQKLMPESDFRFDRYFGEDFFERFGAEEWNVAEAYHVPSDPAGHHVGGYAEFTQEDPRLVEDPMELLFQMDSDRKINCHWGELGVAHFFIRQADLERKDFSRVHYHWDCY